MIKRLPVILLIVSAASCARPSLQPLKVAKKIFSPQADTLFISRHSTGDYSGHPNGEDLPAGVKPSFRLLQQTAVKSVIAMNVSNVGPHADKYLFFTKESNYWKLYAIAAPTLARLHDSRRREMEALTPAQIDSILLEASAYDDPAYKTREDFDFVLNSLRLKLAPDDTLVEHFRKYEASFDSLCEAAHIQDINSRIKFKAIPTTPYTIVRSPGDTATVPRFTYKPYLNPEYPIAAEGSEQPLVFDSRHSKFSRLLISNVTSGGFLPKECLSFHILYDQVGYLYVADEKNLPELNPDKVMMLRKLADHWYLYKVAIYL